MNSQLSRNFEKEVQSAYILGISTTGKLLDSESDDNQEKDGYPDGYFYDSHNKVLVLLESKIKSYELTQDQLNRHQARVVNYIHNDWNQKIITWAKVRDFLETSRTESGLNDKNAYIINHFNDLISIELLNEFHSESFFYKAHQHQELAEQLHDQIIECIERNDCIKLDPPYLNSGNKDCVEYKTNKGSIAAIDLKAQRLILKPGGIHGLLMREKYGRAYSGSYENLDGEYSIALENIDQHTMSLKVQVSAHGTKIIDLLRETIDIQAKGGNRISYVQDKDSFFDISEENRELVMQLYDLLVEKINEEGELVEPFLSSHNSSCMEFQLRKRGKGKNSAIAAIDLSNKKRFILKPGKAYGDAMRAKYGIFYEGTYDNLPGEYSIFLKNIDHRSLIITNTSISIVQLIENTIQHKCNR